MPQAVAAYIESHKDFGAVDVVKRRILTLYREDIMKIKAQYRSRVIALYDMIPSMLSKHEKRVVFSDVTKGTYAEQYAETFFWLTDSMIVNECRRTDDPNIAPNLNASETYIKCYMCDTGLLVSHAFNQHIFSEQLHRFLMQTSFQRFYVRKALSDVGDQHFLTKGNTKLLKIHRIHFYRGFL